LQPAAIATAIAVRDMNDTRIDAPPGVEIHELDARSTIDT
jgi:hypothetical protein